MFPDFIEDAHALPHTDDGFHVEVRGEENDKSIRCDPCEFLEQASIVSDYTNVVSVLKAGRDDRLIRTSSYNHR